MHIGKSFGLWYNFAKFYRLLWKKVQKFQFIIVSPFLIDRASLSKIFGLFWNYRKCTKVLGPLFGHFWTLFHTFWPLKNTKSHLLWPLGDLEQFWAYFWIIWLCMHAVSFIWVIYTMSVIYTTSVIYATSVIYTSWPNTYIPKMHSKPS